MSKSKLIVVGDDVYNIPGADMAQYKLAGDDLSQAKEFIASMESDVMGQGYGEQSSSPSGSVYDSDRSWGGRGDK